MLDQVGQMAVYIINAGSGNGIVAIKQIMITLLAIESGAVDGQRDAYWLQLEAIKHDDTKIVATVLVDDARLTPSHTSQTHVLRYIYKEGDEQPIEYINAIRGGAVTTEFGLLENFFPIFDEADLKDTLFPETGTYLGHEIERTALQPTNAKLPTDITRLELDPELIIGTSRNVREAIGKRDWSGDEYKYITLVEADYHEMIEAGINYYRVNKTQEAFVRQEPVFYLTDDVYAFPEAFYRANWCGMVMFMDEPAVHQAWYFQAHPETAIALKGPAGAARLLEARVKEGYEKGGYASNRVYNTLRRTYNLGSLTFDEKHYPAWEALEWAAYYEMKAGLPGIVHESRFTDKADVNVINAEFDVRIPNDAVNNFLMKFGFFRGAARVFEGDWGIAIYGQMEQSLSPPAMKKAYDMGARYLWYWTSDRLHHMPYAEQLELTRMIRAYQKTHPREPLAALRKKAYTAIVVPDGYIMSTYAMYVMSGFHYDRHNEHGISYRDVLHHAALQVERCIKENISFDIIYNDGTEPWAGYEEAVVIDERAQSMWYKQGKSAGIPPMPKRTLEEDSPVPPKIRIVVERDKDNPMQFTFKADIDNNGKPAGLRSRDWGTPNWTTIEAIWHVFEDTDVPAFGIGREKEHTFTKPGSYRVSVWTCDENGIAARDELFVTVNGSPDGDFVDKSESNRPNAAPVTTQLK